MDFDPSKNESVSNPEGVTFDSKNRSSRDHKRTTVRFTDDEFERIQREAELSGKSLPQILKVVTLGERNCDFYFRKVTAIKFALSFAVLETISIKSQGA